MFITRYLRLILGTLLSVGMLLPLTTDPSFASGDAFKQLQKQAGETGEFLFTLKNQSFKPSLAQERKNINEQKALIESLSKKYKLKPIKHHGYLVNAFVARALNLQVQDMQEKGIFFDIHKVNKFKAQSDTAASVHAHPAKMQALGLQGAGTLVAIIDDGISIKHKDLYLSEQDCQNAKLKPEKLGDTQFTCKVPWGKNYPDGNHDITSNTGKEHGTHVAGIIGGNSQDLNGVLGIAPKTQILALKVFSNKDPAALATEQDMISAIEDAVKLGADVINISMGMPSGHSETRGGIPQAVAQAVNAGTVVVSAAGNHGLNFSSDGSIDDVRGAWDDGTISHPASFTNTFAVGSVDNLAEPVDKFWKPNRYTFKPSPYTSWGSTPSLEFKPNLVAIGGNVRSAYGDGEYKIKQGTSMAAPQVSAVSLLLKEHYKKTHPQLEGSQLAERIQTSMTNTAFIPYKRTLQGIDLPYSTRQVGAGVLMGDRALKQEVFATSAGNPYISFKELRAQRYFNVTIQNTSKATHLYQVPEQKVYNETNVKYVDTAVYPSSETLRLTLPTNIQNGIFELKPGEKKNLQFELTPDTRSTHWLFGRIEFKHLNGTQDINLPYLGFVGDWAAEPAILRPEEKIIDALKSRTQLMLKRDGLGGYTIYPSYVLLRSIYKVEYRIINRAQNVLAKLGVEYHNSRLSIRHMLQMERMGESSAYTPAALGRFRGIIRDPITNQKVQAPAGEYIYRLNIWVNENGKKQILDFPFKIDEHGEPQIG